MRFMMLMVPKGYAAATPDAMPSEELVAAMGRYNERLAKAGILLALDGLCPPVTATRVAFAGGKGHIDDAVDGAPSVGGYWLIQAKSQAEAVEWALRCPAQEGDVIEVRRVHELADFPPDVGGAAGGVPS